MTRGVVTYMVSGTQQGANPEQLSSLLKFLCGTKSIAPFDLLHGDCIGVDEQSHLIAILAGVRNIHIWPQKVNPTKRAFCRDKYMCNVYEHEANPDPLARNRKMVDIADTALIVPRTAEEERRSGTWSTYRYAVRRADRVTILFLPSGEVIRS